METLRSTAIWIPLLPLIGSLLVGAIGLRWLKDRSHWLVIGGAALALVAVLSVVSTVVSEADRAHNVDAVAASEGIELAHTSEHASKLSESFTIFEWMNMGSGSWLDVSFRVDQLTSVMLLVVVPIGFLIVCYSVGYMRDHHGHPERGYERFFAFLGIFLFSMTLLVLAGNFLVLFVGWELVGLSSYLLIGFYYQKPEAAKAARKAFVVNRVGDFGFALGIWLIYLTFGTLDYQTVFDSVSLAMQFDGDNYASIVPQLQGLLGTERVPDVTAASALVLQVQDRVTWIALLLFCGAMGKSAQLPLHVWLPDAMEGPTPVSALIHAATMVTAGVYLVARCSVIFAASPVAMWFVGSIGAATALFAATIALTQYDMKRILAYSTLSQLGYMFLALGVGAFDSAVFHLYTHAFFKACLFLGAGSVMHAMDGVIDVTKFGGLKKDLPITYRTFLISSLALAGVPLLSAFWSKDEIIHAALAGNMPLLGWIGLLTALLTAFYTFRMVAMAFWGPKMLPAGVEHAHESGRWMTVPLMILAVGAVFAGYVGVHFKSGGFLGFLEPHGTFHHFLEPVFASAKVVLAAAPIAHEGHALMYWSSAIAFLGIINAWYFYTKRPTIPGAIALASGPIYPLFKNKYYVDEIYDAIFVEPLRKLGRFFFGSDRYGINSLLFIIGNLPRVLGFGLRTGQQGAMQGYALGMILGLVALLWFVLQG